MKKVVFIVYVLFSILIEIQAQDLVKGQIRALGQNKSSGLYLRWAVDNAEVWALANSYGYTIERTEVIENQNVKNHPIKQILNSNPIIPAKPDDFEMRMDEHLSMAVLAQVLYGKNLDLEIEMSGHLFFAAANQVQQNQQRFELALFAADSYFETAVLAGLAWVDTTAESHRKYLYKIYTNIPDSLAICDTALIWAGTDDPIILPQIRDIVLEAGDKTALISWNTNFMQGLYNAYVIERSEKETSGFVSISEHPVSNFDLDKGYALFLDSIPLNDKTYFYRIKGVDVFGTEGPFSIPVKVTGKPVFSNYPEELKVIESKKNLELIWSFDSKYEKNLKAFKLCRSSAISAPIDTLINSIKPTKRLQKLSFDFEGSNYFTLIAVYKNGQELASYPYLFQVVDSIPPTKPVHLNASVDSAGIVKLSWKANKEKDLSGYRVFKSNQLSQDFIQITKATHKEAFWVDTVSVNTSKSLFYRVLAVDKRGNESEFSDVLEVKRPMRFLPSSPQFISYSSTKDSITLIWVNSSSEDVAKTQILSLDECNTLNLFFEKKSKYGRDTLKFLYPYNSSELKLALRSLTDDGLMSALSEQITIYRIFSIQNLQLKGRANREQRCIELTWTKPKDMLLSEIQLYRKKDNGKLLLLKILDGSSLEYIDKELDISTTYEYYVKIMDDRNNHSPLSKGIKVDY